MSDRRPRESARRDGFGSDTIGRSPAGRVQLSLLHRLMDAEPEVLSDPPISAATAMDCLRASIRADLEALLNSRRRWRSWDAHLTQLDRSLVGFGLSDFAAGAFNDPRRREELRLLVETCIRRFEPRIASLTVTLLETADTLSATMRLRVEALLEADPSPEQITFDTMVDLLTTNVTMQAKEA